MDQQQQQQQQQQDFQQQQQQPSGSSGPQSARHSFPLGGSRPLTVTATSAGNAASPRALLSKAGHQFPVCVSVTSPHAAGRQQIRCSYLTAADGAHSTIRSASENKLKA
jgi:hypothetical protein